MISNFPMQLLLISFAGILPPAQMDRVGSDQPWVRRAFWHAAFEWIMTLVVFVTAFALGATLMGKEDPTMRRDGIALLAIAWWFFYQLYTPKQK